MLRFATLAARGCSRNSLSAHVSRANSIYLYQSIANTIVQLFRLQRFCSDNWRRPIQSEYAQQEYYEEKEHENIDGGSPNSS